MIESLQCFDALVRLAEWKRAPYLIENPVSTISIYWREPDHRFDFLIVGKVHTLVIR